MGGSGDAIDIEAWWSDNSEVVSEIIEKENRIIEEAGHLEKLKSVTSFVAIELCEGVEALRSSFLSALRKVGEWKKGEKGLAKKFGKVLHFLSKNGLAIRFEKVVHAMVESIIRSVSGTFTTSDGMKEEIEENIVTILSNFEYNFALFLTTDETACNLTKMEISDQSNIAFMDICRDESQDKCFSNARVKAKLLDNISQSKYMQGSASVYGYLYSSTRTERWIPIAEWCWENWSTFVADATELENDYVYEHFSPELQSVTTFVTTEFCLFEEDKKCTNESDGRGYLSREFFGALSRFQRNERWYAIVVHEMVRAICESIDEDLSSSSEIKDKIQEKKDVIIRKFYSNVYFGGILF